MVCDEEDDALLKTELLLQILFSCKLYVISSSNKFTIRSRTMDYNGLASLAFCMYGV